MAFRLPAPIADYAAVHAQTVRQYLPQTYRIPINNQDILPLLYGGRSARLAAQGIRITEKIYRRVAKKLSRNRRKSPIEFLRSNYFNLCLEGSAAASLTAESSLAAQIFGPKQIEQIVQQQKLGTANHASALGALLTIERLRALIEAASHGPICKLPQRD